MSSLHLRPLAAVAALCVALSACGQPATCSNEKEVAETLAKLSADVQAASLSNKLSMTQLKELTVRVDFAGIDYGAKKNHDEYCRALASIREDFGL